MSRDLPTRAEFKAQARALRQRLAQQGIACGQSHALEEVARSHGFRDWNGLSAALDARRPKGWAAGDRVRGRYLGQSFTATVVSSERVRPGWFRLVLNLDDAVDVVRFESFSNLRKQIRVVVGPKGTSKERTSNGAPHVELDL